MAKPRPLTRFMSQTERSHSDREKIDVSWREGESERMSVCLEDVRSFSGGAAWRGAPGTYAKPWNAATQTRSFR